MRNRNKSKNRNKTTQTVKMTKSREYQRLLDIRSSTITSLRFHEEKANALEADMQIEALSRLTVIENTYEKFSRICEQLERHDEFLFTDLEVKNEDVVDIYVTSSAKLRIIAKDVLDTSFFNSTHHRVNNANNIEVKLPKISIPTFDGDYQEWTTFHDAFMSLVDQNTSLSDGNKMHYLRSSLKGDALRVVNRLPITDANYKIAMKALVERFQNKRAIINKSLSSLINQPAMKNRNTQEIRSLIDTTKEALECIETLNVCTDEWSPFIVFIMQSKMDEITKHEYEKYLSGTTELPKYKLLNIFLETQFRVLDSNNVSMSTNNHVNNANPHLISPAIPVNDYKNRNQANQNTSNSNANQTKTQSYQNEKCPLCPENHWLLNCQQFLDWSPMQRKEYAVSKNICIKCLHTHEKDKCKSKYQCKKCKGDHSVKLHTVYDDISSSSSTPVATIQETNSVFATAIKE